MSKEDQVIQEKVLSFKTISSFHLEQVTNFIVRQYEGFEAADEETKARLYSMANLMMIPVLKCQWSFALFEEQRIIGVYLQIDMVDYLKSIKVLDSKIIGQLFNVGQFQDYFINQQANLKRGEQLLSIFNVINSSKKSISAYRKEVSLIHQGFYLCKLGGWKNIIFQTDNPIPFLKISADVVQEGKQVSQKRKYLMKINMAEFNLQTSPFQKIYAKL